ncbi:MIF4G-like, type 3 domain and Initiation factor eIF-4 gamma, MA3 domain and MIF4-like, type 1/2/3 domain and Armadillo-type fold domain-containing protein [Strongyloides ratti]|uniref:MIF4G-like, type 3 domain and Initiation factor eIF-4 gamma, MA3 domain and MIF4-like, type 1/2/3 domain and Armadillo-type fold domain-containing protein n=1 Tax=Strongyloides ratti TaxID=34506 RepID=A0A090MY35_STRRB|nr:MIF4G-like, type 3 domain and Initiation factor eIF-4 gamma, MA3 domain and MIF4-like, type 1/2/3 domain and Armadillo-type fold domain-containing protein [Strongyloides ratti]CEF66494.1 MIF4G-like, type 3 domain and Initiation factor eIF-4 gamma, MA3 domain and MIF4-like, type 1/2/3 domain and Armadillo-type fold domain-containing protein [Strongyloides ratti]
MDFEKLLNTKSNRKAERKQKKEFKKLAKEAFHRKKNLKEVIEEKFRKSKNEENNINIESCKKKNKKKKNRNKKNKEASEVEDYKRRMFQDPSDCKVEKLSKEEERERKEMLRREAERDDDDIQHYEKLLGLNKKKKKKDYDDDGLDYLLDFCDLESRKIVVEEEEKIGEVNVEKLNKTEDMDVEGFFNESDNEIDETNNDEEEVEMDEEELEMDEEELEIDEEEIEMDEEEKTSPTSMDGDIMSDEDEDIVEDIYGRRIYKSTKELVDKESRLQEKLSKLDENKSEESKEETIKVEKTIRALMNRLSEVSFVNSQKIMLDTWNHYSKNDVKRLTYKLLLQAIDKNYEMADRMIMEYAAFLTIMHSTISNEITFYIIEHLVCDFVKRIKQKIDNEEYRLCNIGRFLGNLYNFKVINANFLIELFTIICQNMSECNLSLLQSMYMTTGSSLKKRDSTLFDEHLSFMKKKLPLLEDIQDNFKLKFLVEELLELKIVNVIKFTTKFDEKDMLHMVKVIQSFVRGNSQKEGVLGMSVDDLLHASERGRWWIVGSAWQPSANPSSKEDINNKRCSLMNFDSSLLELAKKAKMNLEHRKNIFCIIMSGEDALDVFQRIMSLKLKETQERDIIHVAIICCTLESNYNPFYGYIIEQFCSYNNRFKLTTQFALWDRIKNLNELKKRQRNNLASLIGDLIKNGSVTLGVLRIVDFSDINGVTGITLKNIFSRLFTTTSVSKINEIFEKLLSNPKFDLLAQGLQIFFEIKYNDDEDANKEFKLRLDVVKNLLSTRDQ